MEVRNINSSSIVPDPNQPRKHFDLEKLSELGLSLKSNWIGNPVAVRLDPENNERYFIVNGERRYRASKLVNIQEIPCVVVKLNGKELRINQVIDNLNRENLCPSEIVGGFMDAVEEGATREEVIAQSGKSSKYVDDMLKIGKLPKEYILNLDNGSLKKEVAIRLSELTQKELPGAYKAQKKGRNVKSKLARIEQYLESRNQSFNPEKKVKVLFDKKLTRKNFNFLRKSFETLLENNEVGFIPKSSPHQLNEMETLCKDLQKFSVELMAEVEKQKALKGK